MSHINNDISIKFSSLYNNKHLTVEMFEYIKPYIKFKEMSQDVLNKMLYNLCSNRSVQHKLALVQYLVERGAQVVRFNDYGTCIGKLDLVNELDVFKYFIECYKKQCNVNQCIVKNYSGKLYHDNKLCPGDINYIECRWSGDDHTYLQKIVHTYFSDPNEWYNATDEDVDDNDYYDWDIVYEAMQYMIDKGINTMHTDGFGYAIRELIDGDINDERLFKFLDDNGIGKTPCRCMSKRCDNYCDCMDSDGYYNSQYSTSESESDET